MKMATTLNHAIESDTFKKKQILYALRKSKSKRYTLV